MESIRQKAGTFRFSLKQMNRQQWLVILLLGGLLAVIAVPVKEETKDLPESNFQVTEEGRQQDLSEQTTKRQLEELLSQVEGVGEVRVMLTFEGVEDAFSLYPDRENTGQIKGVLVVAEGAKDPVIVKKIQDAVMALFQVEAHKIKVMKMK